MKKLHKLNLEEIGGISYDNLFIAYWWKLNQLVDAVNNIQARIEEERPAIDNHTIDSLLLQVSQQQEAINDLQLKVYQERWKKFYINITEWKPLE